MYMFVEAKLNPKGPTFFNTKQQEVMHKKMLITFAKKSCPVREVPYL